jgi:hypothetical protein
VPATGPPAPGSKRTTPAGARPSRGPSSGIREPSSTIDQFWSPAIMNDRLVRPERTTAAELAALGPRPHGDAAAVRAFREEAAVAGDVVPGRDGSSDDTGLRSVPVVTYPDEWTFGALQDGALLVLRLLREGLAHGVMCTTGSAFDVQLHGMRPVLTAQDAFRPRRAGEGWPGYGSFCRTFLRPLLLTAVHAIPFHPLLRGCPGGITQAAVEHLTRGRRRSPLDIPGGLAGHAGGSGWLDCGYPHPDPVEAMAEHLEGVVRVLGDLPAGRLGRRADPYRLRRRQEPLAVVEARDRFVIGALVHARPASVLDLSRTDGRYARATAERRALVVSVDADGRRADQVHRSLRRYRCRDNRRPAVLPLVADPTGAGTFGAAPGQDRPPLVQRIAPDLILAVARALDADSERLAAGPDPQADPLVQVLELCAARRATAVLEIPSDSVGLVERQAGSRVAIVRSERLPLRPRTLLELRAPG